MSESRSHNPISRRTLLKSSAAASASLFLAACGAPSTPSSNAGGEQSAANATTQPDSAATTDPGADAVTTEPAIGATVASAEQVEVRFATDWTEGVRGQTLTTAIAMFEEQNPDIKVKLEPIGGDYFDKLQIQFSGGTVADVILFEGVLAPDYIKEGLIADLAPVLAQLKVDASKWRPGPAPAFLQDGKVYAVPFQLTPLTWYYNKTLFNQMDVPLPDGTWDWATTVEMAKRLTKAPDTYGLWILADMFHGWGAMALSNSDHHWTTPDGKKTLVGEPDWADAIRWTIETVQLHKVAPPPSEQQSLLTPGVTNLFATGKIGMTASNAGGIGNFKRTIGDRFEWDVMPSPKAPRTKSGGGMWNDQPHVVTNNAVSRGVVEQATKLVLFLSGEEVQGIIAKDRGSMPTVATLQESDAYLAAPPANMKTVVDELKLMEGPLFFPRFLEWFNTLNKEYEKGFIGEQSIDDTIKNMVAEGDKVLAQA